MDGLFDSDSVGEPSTTPPTENKSQEKAESKEKVTPKEGKSGTSFAFDPMVIFVAIAAMVFLVWIIFI